MSVCVHSTLLHSQPTPTQNWPVSLCCASNASSNHRILSKLYCHVFPCVHIYMYMSPIKDLRHLTMVLAHTTQRLSPDAFNVIHDSPDFTHHSHLTPALTIVSTDLLVSCPPHRSLGLVSEGLWLQVFKSKTSEWFLWSKCFFGSSVCLNPPSVYFT